MPHEHQRDCDSKFTLSDPKAKAARVVGWFCVGGALWTIFAGWFVVTRFSVTHELRIWDIMALRFGCGAVLLLA
jgi:hypothetical protein